MYCIKPGIVLTLKIRWFQTFFFIIKNSSNEPVNVYEAQALIRNKTECIGRLHGYVRKFCILLLVMPHFNDSPHYGQQLIKNLMKWFLIKIANCDSQSFNVKTFFDDLRINTHRAQDINKKIPT